MGYYIPIKKIFYGGHLGSHLVFLNTTRHQIYIFLTATCPRARTESTLKSSLYTLHTKHILHKHWSFLKKAPHFGSHLGNHLEFFINLNDVNLLPFRILKSNMSFKRINNTKLLVFTGLYKHLLHKFRSLSE